MGCHLCPRNCNADREHGMPGYCGETMSIRVARAALHMWEEPCISGTTGSGTVFFCGCPLKCVFCQNASIARNQTGKVISVKRLSEIFLELQAKGACNINLVTPTHFVPRIADALRLAKANGLFIPIVYNTGSYETIETLHLMEGLVDIYLPDLKYCSSALSMRYSNVPDYFEVATAAISEMFRQTGVPVFDEKTGLMKRGLIVRHLLLPGQLADSRNIMDYLHATYHNDIYVSIMSQYTPMRRFPNMPELNRKVTPREYDTLVDYCIAIGIENGFIQEEDVASDSFIPPFDFEGI